MARAKSNTSSKTQENKPTLEEVQSKFNGFSNTVVLRAEVKKVLLDHPKCNKYSIAVPSETANHKVAYAYLTLTEFSDNETPFEVGTLIHIEGHLSSGSYEKNGKKNFTTDIIADKIEEI